MAKETKASKAEAAAQLKKNPVNNFICTTCEKSQVMTFDEFAKHALEVHKLEIKGAKAKKQMIAHMDGDYWFSSTYEWTLEQGLKFTQYTMLARSKSFYH